MGFRKMTDEEVERLETEIMKCKDEEVSNNKKIKETMEELKCDISIIAWYFNQLAESFSDVYEDIKLLMELSENNGQG